MELARNVVSRREGHFIYAFTDSRSLQDVFLERLKLSSFLAPHDEVI